MIPRTWHRLASLAACLAAAGPALLAGVASSLAAEVVRDVPASIDSTGSVEVSTPLMKWLAELPPASAEAPGVVRFARQGIYWVDYTLLLRHRGGSGSIPGAMWPDLPKFSLDHYRLDLNGAVLEQRSRTPYRQAGEVVDARKRWGAPIVATQGATDVQIFGGVLRGACLVAEYRPQFEEWAGVRISADPGGEPTSNVVLRDLTIENVFGDFVYLAAATAAGRPLRDVRIENCVFRTAGRHGVVLNGGTHVVIRGNSFHDVARILFDSEPTAAQGWSDVRIEGNRGASGKLGYFQFAGPKAAVAEKLTITANTLDGGHFLIRLGNADPDSRRVGFEFSRNRAIDSGGRGFGGDRKPAHLIGVVRWRDVKIVDNDEYFTLVGGRPLHAAVELKEVESALVERNRWMNAVDP